MVTLKQRVENLGIDLDETSMDFFDPIFKYYSDKGLYLSREDITSYKMSDFGIEREAWQRPGFFKGLKPFPHVVEVLKRLKNFFKITIVTDALGIDFIENEKMETVERYFPFVDDVIMGSDKSEVKCDLLFDDAPHHLKDFPKVTVKMVRAYNVGVPADFAIFNTNWLLFERLCNSIYANNNSL